MKILFLSIFLMPVLLQAQYLSKGQLSQINGLITVAVGKLNTANATQDSKILNAVNISTTATNQLKLVRDSLAIQTAKAIGLQKQLDSLKRRLDPTIFSFKGDLITITEWQNMKDRLAKLEAKQIIIDPLEGSIEASIFVPAQRQRPGGCEKCIDPGWHIKTETPEFLKPKPSGKRIQ